MTFFLNIQDESTKDFSGNSLNNYYSIRNESLVFVVDFVVAYKRLEEFQNLSLVDNFSVLYEFFYFIWDRKFILSNIFFYSMQQKEVILFSFLCEEYRSRFIRGYISSIVAYRVLLEVFSKIYGVSVNITYKAMEPNIISFYYYNLMDFFFCFKPELLFLFRSNNCFVTCRAVLQLEKDVDFFGGGFDLVILANTLNLNYSEIKEL